MLSCMGRDMVRRGKDLLVGSLGAREGFCEFICEFEGLCGGSVGVSDEIDKLDTATWEALAYVGVYCTAHRRQTGYQIYVQILRRTGADFRDLGICHRLIRR